MARLSSERFVGSLRGLRRRATEPRVLAPVLAIVLCLWGFGALADEVREGDTLALDERVLLALRRDGAAEVPVGPDWLRRAALDLTALGGPTVVALTVAVSAGYLFLRRLRRTAVLVLCAAAGGGLISRIAKHLVARERPDVVPHLTEVAGASFPSGHTLLSAVVYLTLGALLASIETRHRVKLYILACALALTALVGATRVYLGVHYPSDVLAGWTIGLAWALACWMLARWLERRGAVEHPAPAADAE
jgi:undecaprenyl-diphosphatase